jgi:hypothetical protein
VVSTGYTSLIESVWSSRRVLFFLHFFFVSIGQTEQHIFIYYFTAWLSARCIGMYSLKQALYPPQAHCAASDEQPQHILRKPRAFFFFAATASPESEQRGCSSRKLVVQTHAVSQAVAKTNAHRCLRNAQQEISNDGVLRKR